MASDAPETADQASRHDPLYAAVAEDPDFLELRRRYRSFVVPATVAFLAWFLLYVVMSNWAGDFMAQKIAGNINVALVFGLLQFVTTFAIAYLYARYSAARLDPLAQKLHDDFETTRAGGATDGPTTGPTDEKGAR